LKSNEISICEGCNIFPVGCLQRPAVPSFTAHGLCTRVIRSESPAHGPYQMEKT